MKQYEEEIEVKFDRVAEMQALGSDRMRDLEVRKLHLDGRNASMKQQVSFLKLKLDSRKQQLTDSEHAQNLEAQEQKIRQFGQTLHTLRTFIRQKTAESDYGHTMANCLDFAAQLNKIHVERRVLPT